MTTILIATRNTHKVDEIRFILGSDFRYQTLADFYNPPNVVEDAATFEGNARKKAEAIAGWVRTMPPDRHHPSPDFVLADDSGLEVDALNGAPGVHSARFAALDTGSPGNSKDSENNDKLVRLLENVPAVQRTARFRCVVALTRVMPDGGDALATQLFIGACEGRIGFELQGGGGFGYDPLFFPNGYERSFAKLGRPVKNEISHRAVALGQLKKALRKLR